MTKYRLRPPKAVALCSVFLCQALAGVAQSSVAVGDNVAIMAPAVPTPKPPKTGASASASVLVSANKEEEAVGYVRYQKRLSASYSGCLIELVQSEFPLRRSEAIFSQFGNVAYDKLPSGIYSYCVPTEFSSRQALEKYVQEVVRPRAPKAQIIEYRNGVRL